MIELKEIEKLARKFPVEEVLKEHDWKEFERIVAEVFKENEFTVKKNFRFKINKKYEIDIIATRGNLILCVDCKKWSGGRYKKSGIKKSAKDQEKRTRMMEKYLKNNPLLMKNLKIEGDFEIRPMIVTLMEEDLIREGNTFIVPFFKLNSFLLEIENFF